jgi:hypothetical protein
MTHPYQNLSERMRGQVGDLDQIVERARDGWSHIQNGTPEQYAHVDSVALNLHGFYSGIERLFESSAR